MFSVDSNAIALCSAAFAGATTIISLVAPIWTAHINRKATLKLKSAELFFTAKSAAFTEFLRFSSAFPLNPQPEDLKELQRSSVSALLYASESAQQSIGLYGRVLAKGVYTPAQGDVLGKVRANCVLALQNDLKQYEF